jgi:hypothetical protein
VVIMRLWDDANLCVVWAMAWTGDLVEAVWALVGLGRLRLGVLRMLDI